MATRWVTLLEPGILTDASILDFVMQFLSMISLYRAAANIDMGGWL
jgi:hypothetical protein